MGIKRIYVKKKDGFNVEAKELLADVQENLGVSQLKNLIILNRYDVENIPEAEGIKFDALFLRNLDDDDVADKVRGTCNQIGTSKTLYILLSLS